ncbi:hypothetical protein, partial [Salmonella sp. s51228]|uniref:hypothetical protein n=1 Tax=Salmonella sp. s51228 TaxID=3159652 RepID=UPI0039812E88
KKSPGLTKSKQIKSAIQSKKAVQKGVHAYKKNKVRNSVHFYRPKTQERSRKPKYPRFSNYSIKQKKFDDFAIIKNPLTTETSMKKIEENNTLVFLVDPR